LIKTSRDSDVAVIEIDRHERRNALNVDLCHAMHDAVLEQGAAGVRAIVITGAGSSFCSGADLGAVYGETFREALYSMLHAITEVGVPVIAAINGPAIGAGTQLAIACDLRVAAPGAAFAVPTARLGLAVDLWTVRRLVTLCGGGTAQALLIGCDTLDAAGALRCGLASRLGDRDAALAWARELSVLAPVTLAYSKMVLNESADDDELVKAFEACWVSDDSTEGQRARAEKRPPRFRGR